MNKHFVNDIIDLILASVDIAEQGKVLVEKQREHMTIKKTEIFENHKFAYLSVNNQHKIDVHPAASGVIYILFWELSQDILLDCILHFKGGYMDILEVYTPDGTPFETIDLNNISDIRLAYPRNNDMQRAAITEVINNWNPMNCLAAEEGKYRNEIADVLNRYESRATDREGVTVNSLGLSISYAFRHTFGKDFTKPIEECEKIARKILEAIAS